MKKAIVLLALALAVPVGLVAAPRKVPTAALKALKVTRGKPITTGIVFMDGKYIPPPYVVERYGTAIRINKIQVTGPLIAWDEFLKTQPGAKVVTSTSEIPGEAAPEEEEEEEEEAADDYIDDDDPLAALFDDEPAPAKKASKPAKKAAKRKPAGPRQVTTTKVEFNGTFEMNAASTKLVERINQRRTAIDQRLRNDGFYFFGSTYNGANGDANIAAKMLAALPDAMRSAGSPQELEAACREKGLVFLGEKACRDLYNNRTDYVKLIDRRKKMEEAAQYKSLIKGR